MPLRNVSRSIVLACALAVLLVVAGGAWLLWKRRQCGLEKFADSTNSECYEYPYEYFDKDLPPNLRVLKKAVDINSPPYDDQPKQKTAFPNGNAWEKNRTCKATSKYAYVANANKILNKLFSAQWCVGNYFNPTEPLQEAKDGLEKCVLCADTDPNGYIYICIPSGDKAPTPKMLLNYYKKQYKNYAGKICAKRFYKDAWYALPSVLWPLLLPIFSELKQTAFNTDGSVSVPTKVKGSGKLLCPELPKIDGSFMYIKDLALKMPGVTKRNACEYPFHYDYQMPVQMSVLKSPVKRGGGKLFGTGWLGPNPNGEWQCPVGSLHSETSSDMNRYKVGWCEKSAYNAPLPLQDVRDSDLPTCKLCKEKNNGFIYICVPSSEEISKTFNAESLKQYYSSQYKGNQDNICATRFVKDAWYAFPSDVWNPNATVLDQLASGRIEEFTQSDSVAYGTQLCPLLPKIDESMDYFTGMLATAAKSIPEASTNDTPGKAASIGANSGTNSGTNLGTNSGTTIGTSTGTTIGTSTGTSIGANTWVNTGTSIGANSGTNSGTNLGTNSGTNTVTSTGTSTGTNTTPDPQSDTSITTAPAASYDTPSGAFDNTSYPLPGASFDTPPGTAVVDSALDVEPGADPLANTPLPTYSQPSHTYIVQVPVPMPMPIPMPMPMPMYNHSVPCAPTICPGSVGTNTSEKNSLRAGIQELRGAIGSLSSAARHRWPVSSGETGA